MAIPAGFQEAPPRTAIPTLQLHDSTNRESLNAGRIFDKWLASLYTAIEQGNATDLASLFLQEAWWRDLVGLSWDLTSKNGVDAITGYLLGSTAGLDEMKAVETPPLNPQLVDMGPMTFLQSGFTFRTKFGSGRGVARLANVGPDSWKAWTVSTRLERLHGEDELERERFQDSAVQGDITNGVNGHEGSESEDVQVLIIGAGQAGVALAAHLDNLRVRNLVVDKTARVGDAWRARYDTMKSHTPTYMDSFPFLQYPSNFPRWLDRDRIADWIEDYSRIMRLNILCSASAERAEWNESTKKYSIDLDVSGSKRTVQARHIVLATGPFGTDPVNLGIGGADSFHGLVYHSSEHKSASLVPDVKNKKVAIIGCGTSAHDIAQDFVNHGAKSVCMIQRSPMFTVSNEAVDKFQAKLWNTPGISCEDADLLGNSMPLAVALSLSGGMSQMMSQHDKTLLDGLERAGMAIRRGTDGVSILDHQAVLAGHFYIDQGAGQMIVDGRIAIHRCEQGVREYSPRGIVLADGREVDADIIVVATGFERNSRATEQMFGKKIGDKSKSWGSLDGETERIGWWRPTGVAGLWFMTGNFCWCRQFSRLLALQIDAVEKGLNDEYYNATGV